MREEKKLGLRDPLATGTRMRKILLLPRRESSSNITPAYFHVARRVWATPRQQPQIFLLRKLSVLPRLFLLGRWELLGMGGGGGGCQREKRPWKVLLCCVMAMPGWCCSMRRRRAFVVSAKYERTDKLTQICTHMCA